MVLADHLFRTSSGNHLIWFEAKQNRFPYAAWAKWKYSRFHFLVTESGPILVDSQGEGAIAKVDFPVFCLPALFCRDSTCLRLAQ
jgi:hypothetical protein